MADISLYKVGVVLAVKPCPSKGKPLKACEINIGNEQDPITVVTSASNVREGSRVAVAPVGSTVIDESGSEITIAKTSVGGVMSEGMLCDSLMLGWAGGAAGLAVQIPESIEIGASPPNEKPRVNFEQSEPVLPAADVKPLFEKKLTKEEKKKLAEEKRKAKKAAKEAQNAEES